MHVYPTEVNMFYVHEWIIFGQAILSLLDDSDRYAYHPGILNTSEPYTTLFTNS